MPVPYMKHGRRHAVDGEDPIPNMGTGSGGAGFAFDLRLPASSSNQGNSWYSAVGLTAWDGGHWVFKKDVVGTVFGLIRIGGTAPTTPQVVLEIGANATSGVTRLYVASAAVADGESMNPGSLTSETAQDITVPATAYYRKTVTFNLSPTIAANDLVILNVVHEGTHGNDTLAVNTLLWGAWLGDAG